MSLKFRRFRNNKTGEECLIPAGRYGNFLNAIKKFVSYIRYNMPRYYLVHLVLTLEKAESEIHYKHLHRVTQFISTRLKRAGSDFKYMSVKEIQKERLEKYNEKAVHYHLLCAYSKPYTFPDGEEIRKSWGLGTIKITAPKIRIKVNKILSYIGKYIGKGYEYELLEVKKSFTASQIKQIYKLSPKRLADVIAEFGKTKAETFKCTFRKVYEYIYMKKREYTIKDIFLDVIERTVCVEKKIVKEFVSDWEYLGLCDEPF